MTTETFWEQKSKTPNCLINFSLKYLHHMKITFFSQNTLRDRKDHLRYFINWCHLQKIFTINEITKSIIENYQTYVNTNISSHTKNILAAESRKHRLIAIKYFFQWLTQNNYLLLNPADEIDLPRIAKRLPRNILTVKEIKKILNSPDTTTDLGIRDRALLETMYATAVRRAEIVKITIPDLDLSRKTIYIIGKGYKDRYVPLTIPSIHWLNIYLKQVYPKLHSKNPSDNHLFRGFYGDKLDRDTPGRIVKRHMRSAGIHINGSCHIFRHTTATLMLENGADIRYIMELLGHQHLESTQIYTRVSIAKLKEVHTKTHPGKMKPTKTKQILDQLLK